MDLKFIGIGGAFNTELGNTSAYIIKNKKMLLIDCGEDVFSRLKNNNVLENVEEIYIIISHLHGDHVGSLSSLIYYVNFIKNIKPKIIINDEKFCEELCDFLSFSGVNKALFDFVLPQFENILIKPVKTKHTKKLNAFSYIFEENNKLIFYSADSKDIEFLQFFIAENNDKIERIYHDTCLFDYEGNNHTSLEKLKKVVPLNLKHNFYCIHLDTIDAIEEIKRAGFNLPKII